MIIAIPAVFELYVGSGWFPKLLMLDHWDYSHSLSPPWCLHHPWPQLLSRLTSRKTWEMGSQAWMQGILSKPGDWSGIWRMDQRLQYREALFSKTTHENRINDMSLTLLVVTQRVNGGWNCFWWPLEGDLHLDSPALHLTTTYLHCSTYILSGPLSSARDTNHVHTCLDQKR